MSYIEIANWDRFQHGDATKRGNDPKWIKTYTRLLSDDAYLSLTGHRRAILHGLWLEYARSGRQLPDDTRTLTRRLDLKVTRSDLRALAQAGFVELATTPSRHADDTRTARAQTNDDTPTTTDTADKTRETEPIRHDTVTTLSRLDKKREEKNRSTDRSLDEPQKDAREPVDRWPDVAGWTKPDTIDIGLTYDDELEPDDATRP